MWPNWGKRMKEEWMRIGYKTAFLHSSLHSAVLVDLELSFFYVVDKTLMYWRKSCISQMVSTFYWHPYLPITSSYYRNIDRSRINCFCLSVSLTQQNNFSQINILYCSYGSHICGDCAQGTLSYSLDWTLNIVEDLKYTLN